MMAALGVGAVAEGPVVVSLGTSGTGFAHPNMNTTRPIVSNWLIRRNPGSNTVPTRSTWRSGERAPARRPGILVPSVRAPMYFGTDRCNSRHIVIVVGSLRLALRYPGRGSQ